MISQTIHPWPIVRPLQSGRGSIPSFNGRLRDECLNVQVFFTVPDARDKLEQGRLDYNRVRPYSAGGDRASEESAHAWQTAAAITSSDGLRVFS
jgi:transposase InsO family protein